MCSATSSSTFLILVSSCKFSLAWASSTSHGCAFIAHADAALIWTQIIKTLCNIGMNNLTGLQKGFFYIKRSFCWSFHEDKSIFFCEALSFLSGHLASRFQVTFITYQHNSHIGVAILSDFFKPASQMRESISACNIINQKSTCCATVVWTRNWLKGLLSCGIPNL